MKSKIIAILLMLSILFVTIPASALSAEAETITNHATEFPEIVQEEINENGYIRRKFYEEPDLYSLIFENSDGTETMRVFSHPVKYISSDGKVNDISLALQKSENGYVPQSHGVVCLFPNNLSEGISINVDEHKITTIPLFVDSTSANFDPINNSVRYAPDGETSIEYFLTYTGYEEDIVVNEFSGITDYSFKLLTNGLKLDLIENIPYLVNQDGECCAHLGEVYVYSEDNTTNTTGAISVEAIKENEEYIITVSIDSDFLKSASYPIRIDPSVELTYDHYGEGAIEDVTINENVTFSGSSGSLYVGRHPAGSLSRVLMRFPNISMPVTNPDHIVSASVEIRDLMCQGDEDISIECYVYKKTAPSWSESGTTSWTSVGSDYLGDYLDAHTVSYGNGNVQSHRYGYDITALAKAWVSGTQYPSKGIVFKASNAFEIQTGSNVNYWYKTFSSYNRAGSYKPSLTITYSGGDAWGNDWYNSTSISLNSTLSGSINSAADIDMFKFIAPATGYYRFETTGTLDTKAYLYSLNGNSLTQLAYNDDYDYPDNGRNSLIYYRLTANQTVYWAVRGYGSNTGNYSVRISKSTAFIYGYNWGGINTLQDNTIQKPYLTALGFAANDKTANYNMFTTTNSTTQRKEPNHELFVYNGHGSTGCIQLPIGNIYSDSIGTNSFSSNLIALWFCCLSANGNSTYTSMMQASVNEGAKAAFGYTVSVNDAGARVFGKYFVEALTQGATISQAKTYAETHLVDDMPSMVNAVDSPLHNALAGNTSTKLVTDLAFSLNGVATTSDINNEINSEEYVEHSYDDVIFYVFTIDGLETNDICSIAGNSHFASSVSFNETDIKMAKNLIKNYGKENTSKINISENTVINEKRRVVYKFGENVCLIDIFNLSYTENGTNHYYEVYVDVDSGKSFSDFDFLKKEMMQKNKCNDKDLETTTMESILMEGSKPEESSTLEDNSNNAFLTYTEKKVGDWKFTYLTIDGIITNSFTGISSNAEISSKTRFTEEDIVKARVLVDKMNNSFSYKIISNEKLEQITRQIIKNDINQLEIFDIYEVLFEIDDIKYMKNVYVNLITGEMTEELHVLRQN